MTRWSPRLKAVYRACVKLPFESNVVAVFKDDKGRPFRYLIHDRRGNPIRLSSFDSAWRRLMKKAVERNIEPFRAHDLKRKGTTDTKGTRAEKQDAGGWRNESMVDVYDVSVPQVDPTR